MATRYGKVSAHQSEALVRISFENRLVASLEADSISLSRVTPKGRNEYLIIEKWRPGLHCHFEFLVLTIHPDKSTQLSPAFGSCMELASAGHIKNGLKITLASPQIGSVKPQHESYLWVNGKLAHSP